VLYGLANRADQELRKAEDALIAFNEQQAKRDQLHRKTEQELRKKYHFGRMEAAS
jgi:2-phosphoglycerate kinase